MGMGYCDWTSSMGMGTNPDAPEHRRPDPPPPPPPPNESMAQGTSPPIAKYDPRNYEAPPKRRPKYVLECAEVLSDQAKERLRKSLDGLFAPGEVIVLEQGLKIRPIDGKPQDELKALHVAPNPPPAPANKTMTRGKLPLELRVPRWPRHQWKLALATAAVWVAAIATGVM